MRKVYNIPATVDYQFAAPAMMIAGLSPAGSSEETSGNRLNNQIATGEQY